MKITKEPLKQLIKETLEEQEKPEYKGSESAASRLKKSIGSDDSKDKPAKKEKSAYEKAQARLKRAEKAGDQKRIDSAKRAVAREKAKLTKESTLRITKSELQRVIHEELETMLTENPETSKPGQRGRDNPVLYKANQIAGYAKLLQQAARSGDKSALMSRIRSIKQLLTDIEKM